MWCVSGYPCSRRRGGREEDESDDRIPEMETSGEDCVCTVKGVKVEGKRVEVAAIVVVDEEVMKLR